MRMTGGKRHGQRAQLRDARSERDALKQEVCVRVFCMRVCVCLFMCACVLCMCMCVRMHCMCVFPAARAHTHTHVCVCWRDRLRSSR